MDESEKEAPKAPEEPKDEALLEMKRISRRSFTWGGLAIGLTYAGFHYLHKMGTETDDTLPWLFRRGLQFNEGVNQRLYSSQRLSPTFTDKDITEARTNGDIGLGDDFDPASWKLKVEGGAMPLVLALKDIEALPRQEFVAELKCIEGWSFFVKWAGVRLSDFMAKYPPAGKVDYVGMATPDEQYYVGLDMPAAVHPQTLLCFEMNGQPLALEHGAPLRLAIPHKYGVKNIKRIGVIRYQNVRPKDYWAEQGYDWYAGL